MKISKRIKRVLSIAVVLCSIFSFNMVNAAEPDPDVTINVNSVDPTNQDILITIETNDDLSGIKEITLPDGTKISDKNTTYTVTENGEYTISVTDNAGNVTQGTVQITNIDKTLPELTLTKAPTTPTNQDVVITATATDANGISKIVLPDNTEVNGDTATYTVSENGTYSFKAIDSVGNIIEQSIEITNIDKDLPTLELAPSTTEPTNQDVVITATATDVNGVSKIVLPDNTEVNADTATYTVTENGTYSFKAIDTAGNMIEKSIEITNIDKELPVITIKPYNTEWTNQDITVEATVNKGSLNESSHTFTENGSFTFIATDALGNRAEKTVEITNIDKVKPTMIITVGK
jgi:hypothetical protein